MTTTAAVPYFCFPGNARRALERYARIFGGDRRTADQVLR